MNNKQLNLTEEILERVVYGMENQKDRLMLNPSDGLLHPEKENDGSFIPLPPWGPSEGYRLMDGFAASLPDTGFRMRLFDLLHSGSGVFRNFKDALKERPELQSLWRRYKKREMRKAALSWMSRWSEALALETLGPEPEEDWSQLSSSEFLIRKIEEDEQDKVLKWIQLAEAENLSGINTGEHSPSYSEDGDILVAESPGGEIVGFSWLSITSIEAGLEGRLNQVYVLPELRGLGIGRLLINASLKQAEDRGVALLTAKTGLSGKLLGHYFESAGFSPVMTLWQKKV